MRIDDLNRYTFNPANPADRLRVANQTAAAQPNPPAEETRRPSESERIAKLKEAIRSGQAPDLQKLADTLLNTGIFFDERA
jgi:anti-sigma28 factor (negative regulator of flagellin synthesis)